MALVSSPHADRSGALRSFEVVVTAPRPAGELLDPSALPGGVDGYWTAGAVSASARVRAARPSAAAALVEELVPALADAPGAVVTVRAEKLA